MTSRVLLVIAAVGCGLTSGSCGRGPVFGSVKFGSLALEGTVDRDYLARQLLQLHPRFEACFARALRLRGPVEGTIVYRIRGGKGRLVPGVDSNTTADPSLTECVTQAIADLTIVEPEGSEPWDFTLRWPVDFVGARRT